LWFFLKRRLADTAKRKIPSRSAEGILDFKHHLLVTRHAKNSPFTFCGRRNAGPFMFQIFI
jgi:hypothetical protein